MDKFREATLNLEEVILETKVLGIDGMTCDHCVRRVTKALQSVNGVQSIEVNRETARAVVTFDTTKSDLPALMQAVQKGGYPARALAEGEK